ncbi:MAG: transcription termination/antitermination protein NusA [Proteobacteria bacterium]|nr:transcription termination/antitermination protein NusA [Pseudomonadota bacterium]
MALELLQVAEAVAKQKGIDRDSIIAAMEDAIKLGVEKRIGGFPTIEVVISRVEGEITINRMWEIVEVAMEPVEIIQQKKYLNGHEVDMKASVDKSGNLSDKNDNQIALEFALEFNPKAKLGEFVTETLPNEEFGRIAAQSAKQVIVQKVRDAERVKQYNLYKDKVGTLAECVVKRVDKRGVLLDLFDADGFVPQSEMLPREMVRQGDNMLAYIYEVNEELKGHQILLSRTHPTFVEKLFQREVPEIETGLVEVIAVARDAGLKSKVAVKAGDRNIDPVGACVGIRGSRVQSIIDKLNGERIDIISYNDDPAEFLINSLSPAEVAKVVIDEETKKMEVVVAEDNLSAAIGKRGQNVRLASILTGWAIDIMTPAEEADKRKQEQDFLIHQFTLALDVDSDFAELLIEEGFTNIEQLLMVEMDELTEIEGLEEDLAAELRTRAETFIEKRQAELEAAGVEKDLIELEGVTKELLAELIKNEIKTRDDLAELATDELLDMLPKGMMTESKASDLIVRARAHWFEEETTD